LKRHFQAVINDNTINTVCFHPAVFIMTKCNSSV
jgi:hypothetical protein